MDKNLIKIYLKGFLNGFGYASAASTAIVWAFPKLAKKAMGPKARIVCGLTGYAWCIWQYLNYHEKLEEELIENIPVTTITAEDEDD